MIGYNVCENRMKLIVNILEIALYKFTTEDIPHKVFKRDNMNLIMVQKVLLKQALYGTQISIKTLDRKVLRINITQVIT